MKTNTGYLILVNLVVGCLQVLYRLRKPVHCRPVGLSFDGSSH